MSGTRPDADDPWAGLARRLSLAVALVAAVVFVAGTVGPPLFGRGVFLGSDVVYQSFPWRAFATAAEQDSGLHGPVSDTVDAVFPARAAFAAHARDGLFLDWNPWVAGGIPAGVNSSGVVDPFALVFLVVPAWLAPAVIKALQLTVSAGFTFLFCRLLGVQRPAAVFAGLAFAGSGFMVMWSNWQHTDVAALVPVLFWATERFLRHRTVASAVPIAVSLAAMLAGVFPAVVFYALYLLVPYVAVRVLSERRRPLIARLGTGSAVAGALVAGVLLAAAVVLPFLSRSEALGLADRQQSPELNLSASTLVTTVAPTALGLSTEGPEGGWFGRFNQVEGLSFVGVTTGLLAVVALCLPRPRGTPAGVRPVLVVWIVVVGLATYGGGPVLGWLQKLPAFDNSPIGRTRSVLGFAVAVLAGLGAQALLERRRPRDLRRWVAAGAVAATVLVVAAVVVRAARERAVESDRVEDLWRALVLPAAVALLAVVAAVAMSARAAVVRYAAVAAMTGLLVVESLALAVPLLPNEDVSTLYPETPASRFLDGALGDDHMAVEGTAFLGNSTTLDGYRSIGGHAFHASTWKEALLAVDPNAFAASDTFSMFSATSQVVTAPLLDRLGVRLFAAVPTHAPLGRRTPAGEAGDPCVRDTSLAGTPRPVAVPADGRLRGVVLQVCDGVDLPTDARLVGRVEAGDGSAVGRLELPDRAEPGELSLALPADQLSGGVAVTLALEGAEGRSIPVSATATGEVAADAIEATDDGLRLVYAHDVVVYRRTRALPRVRWASEGVIVPDEDERLAVLAGGGVDDDTVVLAEPVAGGAGRPATVVVDEDRPGTIRATVDAGGPGFLVVADAIQSGWDVWVDGEPAELLAADHAGAAVRVPQGRHSVTLRYDPRAWDFGLAVSGLTALALAAGVAWETRRAQPFSMGMRDGLVRPWSIGARTSRMPSR